MKKLTSLCLIAIFLLTLWGCKSNTPPPEHSTTMTLTTEQFVTKIETEPEPRERHEYNKLNPDKNLLLQYLYDEIPLYFANSSKTYYFSELSEIIDEDEKNFYVIDMDMDGKPEFGIISPELGAIILIRYNEQKDCFESWLEERRQQLPLGNGRMYEISSSASYQVYSYLVYDENANLIKRIDYSKLFEGPDVAYEIDTDDERKKVTEKEWHAESAWLFRLIENAPKPLSYTELYDE